MTEGIDKFAEMLDVETFDRRLLYDEPTVVDTKSLGALSVDFVQDLRVQKAVPELEATYSGNKVIEEVNGEILRLEEGELISEEATAGYEYPTDGFVITCNRADLRECAKIESSDDLLAAGYSGGYAFRNTMSRRLGVNTMEIHCSVRLTHSNLQLVLYDSESRGAGLCYPMYQEVESVLYEAIQLMASCTCRDYCESCLLIPRTSEYLLQNDLLNRHKGQALLGLKDR